MIPTIDSWKHDWFFQNRHGIFQREDVIFVFRMFWGKGFAWLYFTWRYSPFLFAGLAYFYFIRSFCDSQKKHLSQSHHRFFSTQEKSIDKPSNFLSSSFPFRLCCEKLGLGLERIGWFRFLVTSCQSQQSGILWAPWRVGWRLTTDVKKVTPSQNIHECPLKRNYL